MKSGRDYLVQALAGVLVILAISGATGIGWLLYTLIRRNRLDNVVEASTRAVSNSFQWLLDMDPIAAVFIFPLIGGGAIVAGMLIWRHFRK
ncbi:MAG: hypothetical protein OEY85_07680 [Rhodospirillales bacterium]|nr:hypothetical protein [Rhodospirillales bacterium]